MEYFEILRWAGIVLILFAVTYIMFHKKKGVSSAMMPPKKGKELALQGFATDITEKARHGKFDPVIGREDEIMRVTQILTRRTKNNVILAGSPGVGKTAIVEGLALRIASGDVPHVLTNKRILSLRVAELLAGTKYRGEFEQRIKRVVEEIRKSSRSIILFVDEIHTVMQAKGTEGSVNMSDILKPALARGDLQLIGATTKKEYEEFIAPDESWARRFQMVMVDEPSEQETLKILQGIEKNYEKYHNVDYTPEALEATVRLSKQYIEGRRLPDKAIDVLDEAGAMVNVQEGHSAHSAAGVLHAASKQVAEKNTPSTKKVPTVDVDDIKAVIAEWAEMEPKDIQ